MFAHNSDRYDSDVERKEMGGEGINIGRSHLELPSEVSNS